MMHLYGSPAIDQEWARFKAGELFSATRLCRDHFDQNLSCGVPLQPDVPTTLQDIDATVLPDRALVEDSYEPAGHRHPHKTNAKACVMALCMFAHLVPFGHRVISTSDCRLYIAVIGHLLPSMAEVPTIDGFQTCILLLLSQFYTGKLKSAAMTNSIAAHFVFYMGAHHEWPTQPSNQRNIEFESDGVSTHLRNLFWVCYTVDKELCLRIRQPSALNDDHCDLAVSLRYLETISSDFTSSLPLEKRHPTFLFPIDIKLSQIKSRAYESLYSKAAFRKSNMELLMNIRTLDASLEAWRIAVPENCRPNVTFYEMNMDPVDLRIRGLLLRLDYLYCVAIIHQASSRCLQSNMIFQGTGPAVGSSIALAVEASRCSLKSLRSACHILTKGACWLVLFNLLAASSLVCSNILDNPASPSAVDDYELLADVPRLIGIISAHVSDFEESSHRDQLEHFVKELIDVAESVVSIMSTT
ncbi:hypothetical protein N7452_003624 [Penicillium brevicompactum]|uniref:Xylanolytic transcriptional activator regulatory domain-containing protein n=1 Tax=Penicillium brevicompactum TaxID=5074 RepID=A0A9W9QTV4_PENBR|nr:hypothetical protein N7452_003624 [Penicillium brevicompactum]